MTAGEIKASMSRKCMVATFILVTANTIIIIGLLNSHIRFMARTQGVMSPSAAADYGLISHENANNAFGPKRVWFARLDEGHYEYRSSWPLIGAVPFDAFGSGVTTQDLQAICKKHDDKMYCETVAIKYQ